MSRARDNKVGYAGRRVGKQLMKHSVNAAELLYIVLDDITDGDNDLRRATKAVNELNVRNAHLSDVGAEFVEGDFGAAEQAGKRMLGETPEGNAK